MKTGCQSVSGKSNADESSGCATVLLCPTMDTPAKRKLGWPKTTWRRTVMIELGEVKHTWFEALHVAIKRYKWDCCFPHIP